MGLSASSAAAGLKSSSSKSNTAIFTRDEASAVVPNSGEAPAIEPYPGEAARISRAANASAFRQARAVSPRKVSKLIEDNAAFLYIRDLDLRPLHKRTRFVDASNHHQPDAGRMRGLLQFEGIGPRGAWFRAAIQGNDAIFAALRKIALQGVERRATILGVPPSDRPAPERRVSIIETGESRQRDGGAVALSLPAWAAPGEDARQGRRLRRWRAWDGA